MAKNDALGITLSVNSAESENEIRKRLGEIIESINKKPNENHEIILKVNSSKTQDNIYKTIEQAIKNIGDSKSNIQIPSLNLPIDKNTITNNIVQSINKAIQELQAKTPVINIDAKLSQSAKKQIQQETKKAQQSSTSQNNKVDSFNSKTKSSNLGFVSKEKIDSAYLSLSQFETSLATSGDLSKDFQVRISNLKKELTSQGTFQLVSKEALNNVLNSFKQIKKEYQSLVETRSKPLELVKETDIKKTRNNIDSVISKARQLQESFPNNGSINGFIQELNRKKTELFSFDTKNFPKESFQNLTSEIDKIILDFNNFKKSLDNLTGQDNVDNLIKKFFSLEKEIKSNSNVSQKFSTDVSSLYSQLNNLSPQTSLTEFNKLVSIFNELKERVSQYNSEMQKTASFNKVQNNIAREISQYQSELEGLSNSSALKQQLNDILTTFQSEQKNIASGFSKTKSLLDDFKTGLVKVKLAIKSSLNSDSVKKLNSDVNILINSMKKAGLEGNLLLNDARALQDLLLNIGNKKDFDVISRLFKELKKSFNEFQSNPDFVSKSSIKSTVSSIDNMLKKIESINFKSQDVKNNFDRVVNLLNKLKSDTNNIKVGSDLSEIEKIESKLSKINDIVQRLKDKNLSQTDVSNLVSNIQSQQKDLLNPNVSKSKNLTGNEMQELDLLIEKLNSVNSIDSFNKIKSEFDNIASVIKKAKSEIGVLIEPDRVIPQVGELQNKVEKIKQIFARLGDGGGNTTLQQAIANISAQVSDLEPKMTVLNGLIKNFKPETATEEKLREITSLYNELFFVARNTQNAVNNALNIRTSIDAIKKDEAELNNLMNNIKKYGTNNNRLYSSSYLTNQYNDLLLAVENAQKSIVNGNTNAGVSVKQLKRDFENLKANVISVGKTGKTFGTKLAEQFSKLGVYLSAATVFMRIRTEIRKMYDNVIEVDSAMTELKKVTEETDATYTKFLNNAISRSKNLGATLSDTISASADMARLGYSLNEASTLADNALIYKQVGDDIEDISDASKSIISTMKAFGINAEDSISIVDKFNEVSNNFAISSGGIGEALQNSASSLAAANNTLGESIALIVAGNDVVQNPNEVGTALKTLSMRLRGAKEDLESLGEDTDGMADSFSDLRDKVLALSGIDILKNNETFKSTYDILKELSSVWVIKLL